MWMREKTQTIMWILMKTLAMVGHRYGKNEMTIMVVSSSSTLILVPILGLVLLLVLILLSSLPPHLSRILKDRAQEVGDSVLDPFEGEVLVLAG